MHLQAAPLYVLAATIAVVLGFDVAAALVVHLAHVPYVAFANPDRVVFALLGYALARRLPSARTALFFVAIAALIEASAGRALATVLGAEPPPPGTSGAFLALETLTVALFTMFWGAIGVLARVVTR